MFVLQRMFYVWGIIYYANGHVAPVRNKAQTGQRQTEDLANETQTVHNSNNNVLLISFDSFRWDYFDLIDTPVLNSCKKYGVHAKYVKNVIPTLTFPNHVSLATGLYPETHGFVGNDMYDPKLKLTFHMPVTDPIWWWNDGVEPIWSTNERQGGLSGVCYWPGFNIDGHRPQYGCDRKEKYAIPYHSHSNLMPYKERVDTVIEWLQKDKPPNFLMMYFGKLDTAAHRNGFGSTQALEEVTRLDNITGYLFDELSKHKLLDKWNIIITADHGMTNLSQSRVINISNYINTSYVDILTEGGVIFVWPDEQKTGNIYESLKHAHPNMKVYLKNDIPEEYHLRNNIRVSPIVLILDEGWKVTYGYEIETSTSTHHINRATHGFLNTYPSMWPLFIARGPAFKKGYFSAPFESVDIYSLMCHILKVKPQPNNGTMSSIMELLLNPEDLTSRMSWTPILVGLFTAVIFFIFGLFVFCVAMCCSQRNIRKMKKREWTNKVMMNECEQTNSLLNDYDDNDNEEICVVKEIDPEM